MEVAIKVGSIVIWVDEELQKHNSVVTKLKRDLQIDLEYADVEPKTVVTSAPHKSMQNTKYGCYWMTLEENK